MAEPLPAESPKVPLHNSALIMLISRDTEDKSYASPATAESVIVPVGGWHTRVKSAHWRENEGSGRAEVRSIWPWSGLNGGTERCCLDTTPR